HSEPVILAVVRLEDIMNLSGGMAGRSVFDGHSAPERRQILLMRAHPPSSINRFSGRAHLLNLHICILLKTAVIYAIRCCIMTMGEEEACHKYANLRPKRCRRSKTRAKGSENWSRNSTTLF